MDNSPRADMQPAELPLAESDDADEPQIGLVDLLTWVGEDKRIVAIATLAAAVVALVTALLMTPIFTARTTLLPPGSQQQSGTAAALASLGALGGLAGGLAAKTPDELYVVLLKGDSIVRALDQTFDLKSRYDVKTFEALRRVFPTRVRIASEKKSGVITVEVDDKDPAFAADLANAHATELTKVLGRLAVSEAQQRRLFFEQQLKDTKERLIVAEQDLRKVQEKTGVIVLDKQAEAMLVGAAQLRTVIAEREVQLKVLRTGATEQNPDVMRLSSELRALRSELARVESSQGGNAGSAVDVPVGKLPEVSIDYVRARRELKLQETLLEGMLRQYEAAKLDEAKEGSTLQQVDKALPPDYKSKPSRALITLTGALLGLLLSAGWVVWRRYAALVRRSDPRSALAWDSLASAWRIRRG